MQKGIHLITLSMPFRLGSVNCYLLEGSDGHILVDTGGTNNRGDLERELGSLGCKPGNLRLIVITHGDFDHTGNAAYLREKFGAKIAMHKDDSGMAELGDMFWNRKSGNGFVRKIIPVLFGFGKTNRFTPDIYLEGGNTLSEYGLDASVLNIPGHSKGSIGILTDAGDLLCGDLFDNTKRPALNSIMDDLSAGKASMEHLKGLGVRTVYPGHGKPFQMEDLNG